MKIELKHIAPYLPYDLKIMNHYVNEEYTYTDQVISTMGVHYKHDQMEIHNIIEHQFKPILRPISDLTEEIQHNGDSFVPIERLFQMAFKSVFDYNLEDKDKIDEEVLTDEYGSNGYKVSQECEDKIWRYGFTEELPNQFCFSANGDMLTIENFTLYQKLFEWHFDIFKLIDNDLALTVQVAYGGGGKK